MSTWLRESRPPSPEVAAAYVEFLELVDLGQPADIRGFVAAHPECDPEELKPFLEAIVEIDGISATGGAMALAAAPTVDLDDARYHVEELVGQGGMGLVFRVHDRLLDRHVALKVVRRTVAGMPDDALNALFAQEMLTSARLEHPNIVPVYDRGITSDGHLYYTMRWVRGRTLADIIRKLSSKDAATEQAFGRMRLLSILHQMALSVAYAHDHGIAHLDLKPANIMIGEYGEVLTLDWGLALPLGTIVATEGGDECIAGTPGYMAPEQIFRRPIDARSDVFALGAMLYECIFLRPAFPGRTASELLSQTLSGSYAPPAFRGEQDLAIIGIIDRALSVPVEDRFPSARALADEIFKLLEGAQERERKLAQAEDEMLLARQLIHRYRRLRDRTAAWRRDLAQKMLETRPYWELRRKSLLWRRRQRIERLEIGVIERFNQATAACHRALGLDPTHLPARRQLAELHLEEFRLAEARDDLRAMALHREAIQRYGDAKQVAALGRGGQVSLRLRAPVDTQVEVRKQVERGPILEAGEQVAGSRGSFLLQEELAVGRYILSARSPGLPPIIYPFRVRREERIEAYIILDERVESDRLVFVPGGRYVLGGDPALADNPAVAVELADFALGRYPVTCAEYLVFLNEVARESPMTASIRVPRHGPGRALWEQSDGVYRLPERNAAPFAFEANAPVVGISWLDAQAYCEWLSARDPEGRRYGLPTSEEWEAAARTADGRFYPWGDLYDASLANNRESHKEPRTVLPVGTFPTDVSPFGIRGLAGNTSDWCANPNVRGNPQLRPVRGGHWGSDQLGARLCHIDSRRAGDTSPAIGFRIRAVIRPMSGAQ